MSELLYNVPGISCGHCVNAITEEVTALDKISSVEVDLETKTVTVTGDHLDDAAVRAAIVEAGYEPESASPSTDSCCGGAGCHAN